MKKLYLFLIIVISITSCSIENFSTSNVYEDDIYYNPSEKPLSVKEIEKKVAIYTKEVSKEDNKSYESKAQKIIRNDRAKYPDFTEKEINNLEISSVELRENQKTGALDTIIEVMNKGFWMNGFKGTDSDLKEAMRTIERFHNGFGYYGNSSEIANNLAYDPDWNVYTRDGKYWWFPTFSNSAFYTSNAFATYPRYNDIVRWNQPAYDSWAFGYQYNHNYGWYGYGRRNYYNNNWGMNPYWDHYDNYLFGFHNPFYYGYNNYGYRYGYGTGHGYYPNNGISKKQKLINKRGRSYGRSTRPTTRVNNTRFSPTKRSHTRVTRSNRNIRRNPVNYNKTARRNTNYNRTSTTRRTINYNTRSKSSRPSYNSSSSSSSSNSSSSSSSSSSSTGRVRRR